MGIDAETIMLAFFSSIEVWWDEFKEYSPGGKWVQGDNTKYCNSFNPVFRGMVLHRRQIIIEWASEYASGPGAAWDVWEAFCKEFWVREGSENDINDSGRISAALINCVERLRGQKPTSIGF